MSKTSKAVVLAAIATIVHPCLAAEPGVMFHGRAGQFVGAERVQAISARTGTASFWQQIAMVDRPGRAGGPVAGGAPVPRRSLEPVAVAQWYGRAGGPLNGRH